MEAIDLRRSRTVTKLVELERKLTVAKEMAKDVACVFATGSYGRLEASSHSDLDVCIVARSDRKKKSKLSLLNEIQLKADLIKQVGELGLPKFDGDGKYIGQFVDYDLVREIGSVTDDSTNSFTTRMLMMLEGRPLLGRKIFREVRESIVDSYWVDYEGHEDHFIPAYLTNDILRLWRTFCVNYEARTRLRTY